MESHRLPFEKNHRSNLVSISSGNTENWGESNMADASPRTDISTDADTDEKNQRVLSKSSFPKFCSNTYFIKFSCAEL